MVFAGGKGGREGVCNFFKGECKTCQEFITFFFLENLLLYDLEWLLKQSILEN